MRLSLFLFFFISLQVVSAQENSNSIITIENAAQLSPLYTINEEFFMASFSQFEEDGTAVFLVDSEYNESAKINESTIRTWDLETQAVTNTINFESGPIDTFPMQIPQNGLIIILDIGGFISVLDYPNGTLRQHYQSSSFYLTIARISGDNQRFIYTDCEWESAMRGGCYPDKWSVRIYNTNNLELLNVLNISPLNTLNGFSVGDLSLSSDSQFLLVESGGGQLTVYNINTGEQIATNTNGCPVPNGLYSRMAFEDDSFTYIQSCWINQNQFSHTVYSWNILTDETRSVFSFEGDNVTHIDVSPDGSILGVLAGTKFYLVNFATGGILKEIEARGFTFDFSPDGHYLLLGGTIYGIAN